MPSFGAAQGEYDFYNWSTRVLKEACGVNIEEDTEKVDYAGLKLAFGAKILLDPTFAITIEEFRKKVADTNTISKNSSLILKGINTQVHDLKLDGHLKAEDGNISGEILNKERVVFEPTKDTDDEIYRIRGFKPAHHK